MGKKCHRWGGISFPWMWAGYRDRIYGAPALFCGINRHLPGKSGQKAGMEICQM